MRKPRGIKLKRNKYIVIMSLITFMFLFTTGYAVFSTKIKLNAKGNIKDKSRIIKAWVDTSNEDFHTDFYREKIVSATFLNTNTVPSNASEAWDVSEDGAGGVKAYVIPNAEDNTKYDLFIGAKKGVIANTNSSNLFSNFTGLETINFNNNYDTTNVLSMRSMFLNCTSITSLDLSSFDTSKVTDMYAMFCFYNTSTSSYVPNKLEEIIFGEKFYTNNVTNMRSMFAGIQNIEILDLSTFDTSNVTNMFHMFQGSNDNKSKLKTILVSDKFITTKVTDSTTMFRYLTKLIGGNGTPYSSSHMDKEYARIDTVEAPGYFTLKQ